METFPITLMIAEDHILLRAGLIMVLRRLEQFKVIGEAKDGIELLELVKPHQPHIVLTDIQMPRMNGIEAATQIQKQFPRIGIIAFTMLSEPLVVQEMIRAGAKGYILKNAPIEEIVMAIEEVHKGKTYYCNEVLPFIK